MGKEADVALLKADAEWLAGYKEGIRLAVKAWGWDLDVGERVQNPPSGMGWTNWDVRSGHPFRFV